MSKYAVINPATGETVKEYPEISDGDLAAAIGKADEAHRTWSQTTTVAERAAMVQKVADFHIERREALAEIIVREMGKPIEQALGEVDFCGDIYGYYADNAEEFLKDEPIDLSAGDGTALVRRTSVGPLLGIMPWNFPYYQVARFAGPEPRRRQHDPAEAGASVPRIGGGDPGDVPGRRLPRRCLRDDPRVERPDRRGDRRSAGPGRLADRLRAGRSGGRRDRRPQPEEGRARARRLRSVRPARGREPRRGGRCRRRRPTGQHGPVLQRRQAVHRRRRALRRLPREVHGQDDAAEPGTRPPRTVRSARSRRRPPPRACRTRSIARSPRAPRSSPAASGRTTTSRARC